MYVFCVNQVCSDREDCAPEGQNGLKNPQVHLDSVEYTHGALGASLGTVGSFWA